MNERNELSDNTHNCRRWFAAQQRQPRSQSAAIRRVNAMMRMAKADGQLKPIHRFRRRIQTQFKLLRHPMCSVD